MHHILGAGLALRVVLELYLLDQVVDANRGSFFGTRVDCVRQEV